MKNSVQRGQIYVEINTMYDIHNEDELEPHEREYLKKAEAIARRNRYGLWAQDDPMAPWECRKIRGAGGECR